MIAIKGNVLLWSRVLSYLTFQRTRKIIWNYFLNNEKRMSNKNATIIAYAVSRKKIIRLNEIIVNYTSFDNDLNYDLRKQHTQTSKEWNKGREREIEIERGKYAAYDPFILTSSTLKLITATSHVINETRNYNDRSDVSYITYDCCIIH